MFWQLFCPDTRMLGRSLYQLPCHARIPQGSLLLPDSTCNWVKACLWLTQVLSVSPSYCNYVCVYWIDIVIFFLIVLFRIVRSLKEISLQITCNRLAHTCSNNRSFLSHLSGEFIFSWGLVCFKLWHWLPFCKESQPASQLANQSPVQGISAKHAAGMGWWTDVQLEGWRAHTWLEFSDKKEIYITHWLRDQILHWAHCCPMASFKDFHYLTFSTFYDVW